MKAEPSSRQLRARANLAIFSRQVIMNPDFAVNGRVRKRKVQPWSSEGTPSARFKVTSSTFNDPSPR